MKAGTTGEATVHIAVNPDKLYDLVSDVRRMGEWSPECTRCEWLDGASGPAVGARFKGTNKRGLFSWSTKPKVVTADPGRAFAFTTAHMGRDMTKWSYRFEPAGDGAAVTESFEILADIPWYFTLGERLMGVKDRKADLEAGMRATLDRLKVAAEGSA
jgi:Polyketide cyclase / dehydrase and lipid transport